MKKINILFFILSFVLAFGFGIYSYFYDGNSLEKYKTRENIELLTSEYKSGEDFLSELKTEEEIVDWLRMSKINKELSTEIGNLEELSEEDYKEKLYEYIQKYPIEEFYVGKEKQLSLAREMLEDKDSSKKIKEVKNKFNRLSLDDKYFVSNYIRHKNLSEMDYNKNLVLLNFVVDEIADEYKETGLFIGDVSEEEFSMMFNVKINEIGLTPEDLISPMLSVRCDMYHYDKSIPFLGMSLLKTKYPVSYRDVRNSSSDWVCDTEFRFKHKYTSNTRITGKNTALDSLIQGYGNQLIARTEGNDTIVLIGIKRFIKFLSADDIKNSLQMYNY